MYGVQASFLSEMFGATVRYSGASLGYQLAAPIGGGLIPVFATYLVSVWGGTWPVAVMMIALAILTVVAVYFARETASPRSREKAPEADLVDGKAITPQIRG